MSMLSALKEHKIVAIARGISPDCIPELVDALTAGGVRCIEVTFDHTRPDGIENTLNCIHRLSNDFGERIFVGAGTVLTAQEVQAAVDAGAGYIISPNVNAAVIAETKRLDAVSIPGAMTPTECQFAVECGADLVKLFPAGTLGLDYFKAISAPLKHISFVPTGGMTPENLPGFIKAGAVGAGIGSNLINLKNIRDGRYDLIAQTARAFMEAAKL